MPSQPLRFYQGEFKYVVNGQFHKLYTDRLESFTCYCSNTGLEQTMKQESAQKDDTEEENSPEYLLRLILATSLQKLMGVQKTHS